MKYAERKEIVEGIIKKYHPDWQLKPDTTGAQSEARQRRLAMNPVPPSRRAALEAVPNEPT